MCRALRVNRETDRQADRSWSEFSRSNMNLFSLWVFFLIFYFNAPSPPALSLAFFCPSYNLSLFFFLPTLTLPLILLSDSLQLSLSLSLLSSMNYRWSPPPHPSGWRRKWLAYRLTVCEDDQYYHGNVEACVPLAVCVRHRVFVCPEASLAVSQHALGGEVKQRVSVCTNTQQEGG